MATQFGLKTSRKILPFLAAFALFGLSACGDSSDKNECTDVTCETPAPYCDGEVAVSYSGGGICIKSTGVCDIEGVERRLDCSTRPGETCIDGFCAPEPLCNEDSCAQPDPTCVGTTNLITYSGAGICDDADGTCDFDAVATTTDCADNGEVCKNGACEAVDHCPSGACSQPDDTCDGTNLITYSGAGICDESNGDCDYDTVTTTVDCADTDQVCQLGACVDEAADLCDGITCDAAPAPTCDGDTAVTYGTDDGVCVETDGTCDYSAEKVETDCTDDGKVCDAGACVDVADPCDGVTCDAPPAPSCDGDTAVTYTTNDGVCVEADGSCDYSAEKVETDCSTDGDVCNAGVCVDPTALCDGITCDTPPASSCDGDTAVTYTTNDGVCVEADGSCDYSAEKVEIDCTSTGETCAGGACVAVGDNSVNPGDLIITELMPDPKVVNDSEGEYFEVYNTTGRTLHLNGLVISDKNNASFEVTVEPDAPIEVAPQSYFLFGRNTDTSENGGIDVDFVWSGFNLTNNADTLTITRPGDGSDADVEIDRVEYGPGTGFPSVKAGKSMQFGSENDFADHGDVSLWCHSTEPINPSDSTPDLGTPGAENTPCN